MTRPPKDTAIQRLQRALAPTEALKQRRRGSSEFEKWHRDTYNAIAYTFGKDSRQILHFDAIFLDNTPQALQIQRGNRSISAE